MDITIEHVDGIELVRMSGELRREAGEVIEEQLHPLIAPKHAAMAIDLSGVDAIDSSGLSQLISLATHARMCESQVVLFAPTAFVAGVFEVTRLDSWFDIAADQQAATQLLKQSRAAAAEK
jgi:anti-anti-sigma factor